MDLELAILVDPYLLYVDRDPNSLTYMLGFAQLNPLKTLSKYLQALKNFLKF